MANYTKITKCRICQSKKLTSVGSLGMISVSDFTTTPMQGVKMPLEMVFCAKCTLVQLAHDFNRSLLYKNYWYVSGLNKAIVADLSEIAAYAKETDVHIDIAANDGTLLRHSKAMAKIAVDPSNITPKAGMWIRDYWENVNTVYADLITAIACLYDLPDPNKFIANVAKHLVKDGLFICQFQPLSPMVELNDVGNICHEHLEYYSYKSLVYLFEQNELEIFKVETNNMNGGSYRVFARHLQKGSIKFKEKEYGVKELKDFFKRIQDNKFRFMLYPFAANISGYGASTKMGTITQYYGWQPNYVVDVNPDKVGKYTNTGSLIVAKIPKDTQYLWVFPYGFLDYFKQREKGYKGKWVTTIPKFKIE